MTPTTSDSAPIPSLTLQQEALATAMLHRVGNAATNFTLRDGYRVHENPDFSSQDFGTLISDFRRDPKESLAWARESLFNITTDPRLSVAEKDDRLDRYLDAYFGLIIELDHRAFPETSPGEISEGVPSYIPDGFVDMGGESEQDPRFRGREMIWVDKASILQKYKPFVKALFTDEIASMSLQQRKSTMFAHIAKEVYFSMPYKGMDLGGGLVELSKVDGTVCRHHALVFQVLAQTLGLKSQVLKSYVSYDGGYTEKHSTNMIRVDNQWHILDPTSPDYIQKADGSREWRPAVFRIDSPPNKGESKRWIVETKHGKQKRTYLSHDEMYWFIAPIE